MCKLFRNDLHKFCIQFEIKYVLYVVVWYTKSVSTQNWVLLLVYSKWSIDIGVVSVLNWLMIITFVQVEKPDEYTSTELWWQLWHYGDSQISCHHISIGLQRTCHHISILHMSMSPYFHDDKMGLKKGLDVTIKPWRLSP